MLQTLHRHPISIRKKIAIAAILIAICALVIPLWLLETTQILTIANKRDAEKINQVNNNTFEKFKKEVSTVFGQYQELKNTIDNFKAEIQSKSEQTKLPTLPN
jgi:hypothetical protein